MSGIGPEICDRALRTPSVRRALVPVLFGDGPTLDAFPSFRTWPRVAPEALTRPTRPTIVEVTRLGARDRQPGRPTRAGGMAQYAYIQATIEAAQRGLLDGLCTAPVSKEQISRAGIPFMGHTEVLAEAFGREVLMLMDGPRLKVALATNHIPLAEVPGRLHAPRLTAQLKLLSSTLAPAFGHRPRIAVCGLNPHAGEGGLLGQEERTQVTPAIRAARRAGVDVSGPHPADGLFASLIQGRGDADVVLALFHDQGLIPAKVLDFEKTVNVTLGLPVPRTSPDHGTAYDLAGTGTASAIPMRTALLRCAALATPAPGPLPRSHPARPRSSARAPSR